MNLRMNRMGWLMLAVLAAFGFCSGTEVGAAEPFRIYLVLWRGWEDAAQGFNDYFKQNQIPVELLVRDSAQDKSRLPEFVAEARALKPDLVATWGTTVAIEMLGTLKDFSPEKHITDIPAVFMIVSQPVGLNLVPDYGSSGRNITGTRYLVPEETQLKAARSYLPFSRLGVLYNPTEPNSVINVEDLRRLAAPMSFELVKRPLPLDADGKPVSGAIHGLVTDLAALKPILLYQGADSFLNIHRDLLTEAALAGGIPVLAAGENPVRRSHALLGVINRYYAVGQLTAFKAKQILVDKVEPKDIPIDSPKRFSYMINMRVARRLGMYPPMNILKFAEIVE